MKIVLNPREEEIMQILWRLQKAFVKDIIAELEDPNTPYNTVSSIVRKLAGEGHIGFTAYGNTHQYHPILKKGDYTQSSFRHLFEKYFDASAEQLLSFFIKEEKVDPASLEALVKKLKNEEK